jgi:hypothetical protein
VEFSNERLKALIPRSEMQGSNSGSEMIRLNLRVTKRGHLCPIPALRTYGNNFFAVEIALRFRPIPELDLPRTVRKLKTIVMKTGDGDSLKPFRASLARERFHCLNLFDFRGKCHYFYLEEGEKACDSLILSPGTFWFM